MPAEQNNESEVARLSSELAITKTKLDEERRKRETEAHTRLEKIEEKLDTAKDEILSKVEEVKLTYATATRLDTFDNEVTRKFEKIDARLNDQARLIYMAMGGLLVLQVAAAMAVHFWK